MGAPESGDMERDHAETVRKLVSPRTAVRGTENC